MFGGIIEHKGKIERFTPAASGGAILIIDAARLGRRLKNGDSISVDGICLTVVRKQRERIIVDVSAETLDRTNIAGRSVGDEVNLELPLTLSTFLSGHLVQGHVEGTGVVRKWVRHDNDVRLYVSLPRQLSRYCVSKGSIAINGVSLTIASKRGNLVGIALIPYTLENTNLGGLQLQERVNIETDVIGRYVVATIKKNYDQVRNQKSEFRIKKPAARRRRDS